jgi:tetratricopeptide (TPR) repeat protein
VRAYSISPSDKQLYVEWPRLEAQLGNDDRARALFRRGLQLHPSNVRIMNLWACWEAEQGHADEARALHMRALSSGSLASTMHNRVSLAKLEAAEGEVDVARQLLRAGLDAQPDFPAALVMMAAIERREGNLDMAEAYVRRAQKVAGAFDVAVVRELQLLYQARGEGALERNLGRHSVNVAAFTEAKRSGAWASEAWEAYYAANAMPQQRAVAAIARNRKVALGLIRDDGLGGGSGSEEEEEELSGSLVPRRAGVGEAAPAVATTTAGSGSL